MTVIRSFENIKSIISKIQNERIFNDYIEHYRGLSSFRHELKPTIVRNLLPNADIKEIEKILQISFREKANNNEISIPTIDYMQKYTYFNDWDVLYQARHYGIKSRFIDWTLKWEVALWFAVEDESYHNEDGIFWVLKCPSKYFVSNLNKSTILNINPIEISEFALINYPYFQDNGFLISETRRRKQFGRFSIQHYDKIRTPLNEQNELNEFFEKFIIDKYAKKNIKEQLLVRTVSNDILGLKKNEKLENFVNEINEKVNNYYSDINI